MAGSGMTTMSKRQQSYSRLDASYDTHHGSKKEAISFVAAFDRKVIPSPPFDR